MNMWPHLHEGCGKALTAFSLQLVKMRCLAVVCSQKHQVM